MTSYLQCSNCNADLIPAKLHGYFDDQAEFIAHAADCPCPDCGPIWRDDQIASCVCGVTSRVEVDGEHAFAVEVDP